MTRKGSRILVSAVHMVDLDWKTGKGNNDWIEKVDSTQHKAIDECNSTELTWDHRFQRELKMSEACTWLQISCTYVGNNWTFGKNVEAMENFFLYQQGYIFVTI